MGTERKRDYRIKNKIEINYHFSQSLGGYNYKFLQNHNPQLHSRQMTEDNDGKEI